METPDMTVQVLTEDSQSKRSGVARVTVTIMSDNGTTLASALTNDNGTAALDLTGLVQGRHILVHVSGYLREGIRLYQSGTDTHGLQTSFTPGMEQKFIVMPSGQVWPDYLQWESEWPDNDTEPAHDELKQPPVVGIQAPSSVSAPYMRKEKLPVSTAKVSPSCSALPCGVEMMVSDAQGNPLSGMNLQLQFPDFLAQSVTTGVKGTACLRMPVGIIGPYCGLLIVDAGLPKGKLLTLPAKCASSLSAACWVKASLPVPLDPSQIIIADAGYIMQVQALQAGAQPKGSSQEISHPPTIIESPIGLAPVKLQPTDIPTSRSSDLVRKDTPAARGNESQRSYAFSWFLIALWLLIAGICWYRKRSSRKK
jgi:hypothetical protein